MPRRSSRAVPASAAAPAPAPKRRASDRLSTVSKTAPKRQKYNSAATTKKELVKSTTKKSKYFEPESSEEPVSEPNPESDLEDSASAYEDNQTTSAEPESQLSDADFTDDGEGKQQKGKQKNENEKAKPRGRRGNAKPDDSVASDPENETVTSLHEKELWREGVKTGLGPGKEVIFKKPKARDPGNVPYQDDTLHPNTMLFLQDLTENNDRQWLKAHDADFRAAKKDWETFVESLTEKLIEKDGTIPELPAKDLVFRIHRDIRFSKDPTPYKTHFSAAWSRTGKKGPYAAYYVHLQPGSCFVGSGLWHPEADKLALVREDIDQNSHRLKSVLRAPEMRREIFKGTPDDEVKTVKAFVNLNKESALKTRPKGYDIDNDNIQLLRLRSFTIGKSLSDADLMGANAQDGIATLISIMEPFVTYLNGVVMPDPVDQGSSSESDAAEEES